MLKVYELLLCKRVFNWASNINWPENTFDPSVNVQLLTVPVLVSFPDFEQPEKIIARAMKTER